MKKILTSIAVSGLVAGLAASLQAAPPQAADPYTSPRISPLAQAAQVVGITGISVTYGRPAVKDREVFGELEPWGQVWRTGANDATTITFSDDVTVEGEKLAAGTYALFTIPEKEGEWTVIFNKNHAQWGAFQYSEDDDVLRVEVRPQSAAHQELFTVDFPEVNAEDAVLRLRWASTAIPIRIAAPASEEELIARARRAGAEAENINHVWEWTGYLLQKDVTIPEMLEWTDRIAEAYPGYYAASLKANVLAKMGRTREAITTAEAELEMGKKELGKNQFLTQAQLDAFAETIEQWRATRVADSR